MILGLQLNCRLRRRNALNMTNGRIQNSAISKPRDVNKKSEREIQVDVEEIHHHKAISSVII